jgi:hypothetical protein
MERVYEHGEILAYARYIMRHVADQRPAVRAGQVVKGPCRRVGRRTLLEPRDIDKDAAIALGDRTRCQTFRPTFALPGTDRETPTVIATDERAPSSSPSPSSAP